MLSRRSLIAALAAVPALASLPASAQEGGDASPEELAVPGPIKDMPLGDANRDLHDRSSAARAYKRYLELAPPDAPARAEVTHQLSLLGIE